MPQAGLYYQTANASILKLNQINLDSGLSVWYNFSGLVSQVLHQAGDCCPYG